MTTAIPVYGSANTITLTSSGLASSSTLVAGRASTAIDNTVDDAVDAHVGGTLITTATTATNSMIQIWAYASYDGTNYTNAATGTDANLTVDIGARNLFILLQSIANITTTALTYTWGPISIAQAFGGTMPVKWGLWLVQSTTTALAAGGVTKYTPIKYQST